VEGPRGYIGSAPGPRFHAPPVVVAAALDSVRKLEAPGVPGRAERADPGLLFAYILRCVALVLWFG